MDEEYLKCCLCGTSQEDDENYLNTKMKIQIAKCGHGFCTDCSGREFQMRREIKCGAVACGKIVKKTHLQDKSMEELQFTKETSVRKKILKDFNQTEDDFDSLQDYNDYLENVENLIYDIVNGDEAAKTAAQRKWKEYRQENLVLIATNDAKKAEEERRLAQLLEQQQDDMNKRRLLQYQEDSRFEQEAKKQKAQLMEVALGERDLADVTAPQQSSTAVPIDQPITAEMEAAMIGFQPGVLGINAGPQPTPVPGGKKGPKFGVGESKKFREKQQKAGGYDPNLQFCRSRSEAWGGIFLSVSAHESSDATPMEIC